MEESVKRISTGLGRACKYWMTLARGAALVVFSNVSGLEKANLNPCFGTTLFQHEAHGAFCLVLRVERLSLPMHLKMA